MIASTKTQSEYDVIVVGSGAAGGQTAYTLTMEGVKVLMLEAGRNYDVAKETPMFQTNGQAPLRGASTPDKEFGFHDATVDGGWDVPGEPYTNASSDPDRQFMWWRARMMGGRTNHWGRHSLRNGPYDFKPKTRDGLGFDWPLNYEDLADYYDKVEMLIGVYGTNEGMENTPDSSPGVLQPPPKPRAHEILLRHKGKDVGIPIIPFHRAVLTERLDGERLAKKLHPNNPTAQKLVAADMNARAACFWATPCGRGCSIRANYQSTTVHLPPALASGNLDILPNALVREVTLGRNGGADGVIFIDRQTGKEHRVKARVVVLAASACESVRILLNSKSAAHPDGLANSSGLVGKYIMDTVGARMRGQLPALENLPPMNDDGAGGSHLYAPWWLYQEQLRGELGFARGYHIEISGGRTMPGMSAASRVPGWTRGAYGKRLKEAARRYYGSVVSLSGRGEMIPNEDSYCDLDPEVKDQWGTPALRFHWKWSEHETRQAAHMQRMLADLILACGGRLLMEPQKDGRKAISKGGEIIHEVGGTIMGDDPANSVVNQWCQTWDVPNLFVTDGACFPSNADKNPTETIMALAWRASDYLVDELRKGNLA